MDGNPVIEMMGRRLRLAVIGGGPGSFIGAMHRTAARLDDRYELVAGALSSDPERSRRAGDDLGIDRVYADGMELLEAEAGLADGAEVVAVMTPNDSHHRYADGGSRARFRRHHGQADHQHRSPKRSRSSPRSRRPGSSSV